MAKQFARRWFAVASAVLMLAGCSRGPLSRGKSVIDWRHALQDSSIELRREAAEALGELGPDAKAAAPDLAAALKDKDDGVRIKAAAALWSIGSAGATAVPDLIAALQDKRAEVRLGAAGALGAM